MQLNNQSVNKLSAQYLADTNQDLLACDDDIRTGIRSLIEMAKIRDERGKERQDLPCARYSVIYSDGNKWTTSGTCHGHLSSAGKGGEVIASSSRYQFNNKEMADFFYEWLYRDSPYAKTHLIHTPKIVDGIDVNSLEFRRDFGVIFYDLRVLPANVMMNVLIASRYPTEWYKTLLPWYEMCHKYPMIDKGILFQMSQLFRIREKTLDNHYTVWYTFTSEWSGDLPAASLQYFRNWLDGLWVKPNKPFWETGKYGPVNALYGDYSETQDRRGYLIGSYAEKLYNMYGQGSEVGPKLSSVFGDGNSSIPKWVLWRPTEEEIVNVMLSEQARLKLDVTSSTKDSEPVTKVA